MGEFLESIKKGTNIQNEFSQSIKKITINHFQQDFK